MEFLTRLLKSQARRGTAVLVVAALFWSAQVPQLPDVERALLASRFHFSTYAMPTLSGYPVHAVRAVNPSLSQISAWISSFGASVALNDLDGDGLPNDICHVDPRIDQVIVTPVPGTGARYAPFALNAGALYDPSTMAPMGCLPGDLNEDGWQDILVYYWGRTPIAFLRRPGSRMGPDAYLAQEIIAGGERWYSNAGVLADLDGDGHLDLVIGNYFPDNAQILDAAASNVEQMQHSFSRAYNGGGPHFLLWKGATGGAAPSVRFEDVLGVLGDEVGHGWTLAVGAGDLDGDLLPELYLANDFGPDRLLHNRSERGRLHFAPLNGVKGLTTPNSKVLGRDSFKGMGVDFADVNGDGLLDIYVSNIANQYALEESHFVWTSTGEVERMKEGIAPYVDQSESLGLSRSGWGWDARLADFNNAGVFEAVQAVGFIKGSVNRWPELQELAMGNDELLSDPRVWPRFQPGDDLSGHNHSPFFVRATDGRYYDLSTDIGLDESHVGRGIAIADVDGDGRLDFAVANQWDTSYFYRNDSPNAGAFMGLHLLLPLQPTDTSITTARDGHPAPGLLARAAIGAQATIHLPDGRKLVAQVDGGNGHSGKRSPDLHFGLGQLSKETPLRVELQWRDPGGAVRRESLQLTPGWHTVLFGW